MIQTVNASNGKSTTTIDTKKITDLENRLDTVDSAIDSLQKENSIQSNDISNLKNTTANLSKGEFLKIKAGIIDNTSLTSQSINTLSLISDYISANKIVYKNTDLQEWLDLISTAESTSNQALSQSTESLNQSNQALTSIDTLKKDISNAITTKDLHTTDADITNITGETAEINDIVSHSITTDDLSADSIIPTNTIPVTSKETTITIPAGSYAILYGTSNGKYFRVLISEGFTTYSQEVLSIIKSISVERTGNTRVVINNADDPITFIQIKGDREVTSNQGDSHYTDYQYTPQKQNGTITKGFDTTETEFLITGTLHAFQIQADEQTYERTSVENLIITNTLTLPKQWNESGVIDYTTGEKGDYLTIDAQSNTNRPTWKSPITSTIGSLSNSDTLITEQSVGTYTGTAEERRNVQVQLNADLSPLNTYYWSNKNGVYQPDQLTWIDVDDNSIYIDPNEPTQGITLEDNTIRVVGEWEGEQVIETAELPITIVIHNAPISRTYPITNLGDDTVVHGSLTADEITANTVNTNELNVDEISTDDLKAKKGTIDALESNKASITCAEITDTTIENSTITNAVVTCACIGNSCTCEAVIDDLSSTCIDTDYIHSCLICGCLVGDICTNQACITRADILNTITTNADIECANITNAGITCLISPNSNITNLTSNTTTTTNLVSDDIKADTAEIDTITGCLKGNSDTTTNATCFDSKTYAQVCEDILKGCACTSKTADISKCICYNTISGEQPIILKAGNCTIGTNTNLTFNTTNNTLNTPVLSTPTANITTANTTTLNSTTTNLKGTTTVTGTKTTFCENVDFCKNVNAKCICTCYLENSGNSNLGGNVLIGGDLTVNGTMHVKDTEQLSSGADIFTLRQNNNDALSAGCVSGMYVNKYNGTDSLVLGTDNTGTLRVGESAGSTTTLTYARYNGIKWQCSTNKTTWTDYTVKGAVTGWNKIEIDGEYTIYEGLVLTNIDVTKMKALTTREDGACLTNNRATVWDSSKCGLTTPATICGQNLCGTATNTECVHRVPITTGTCYLAMLGGTSDLCAPIYVSNACKVTFNTETGALSAVSFTGTSTNATCFNGCTFAQACTAFRSGLTSCTGTVTSVNVSVNGCSGTAVTTSGTVTITKVNPYIDVKSDNVKYPLTVTTNVTAGYKALFTPNTNTLAYNPSNCMVYACKELIGEYLSVPNIYGVLAECAKASTQYPVTIHARCTNASIGMTDTPFCFCANGKLYSGTTEITTCTGTVKSVNVSVNGCTGTAVTSSGTVTISCIPPYIGTKADSVDYPITFTTNTTAGYKQIFTDSANDLKYNPSSNLLCTTCISLLGCLWVGNIYSHPLTAASTAYPIIIRPRCSNASCGVAVECQFCFSPNGKLYTLLNNTWTEITTCTGTSNYVVTTPVCCSATAYITATNANVWSPVPFTTTDNNKYLGLCNSSVRNVKINAANGNLQAPNIYVTTTDGQTSFACGVTLITPGIVELSSATPAVDFHHNKATADYSVRLINDAQGRFVITATNATASTAATQTSSFYFCSNGCFLSANCSRVGTSDSVNSVMLIGTATNSGIRIRACTCPAIYNFWNNSSTWTSATYQDSRCTFKIYVNDATGTTAATKSAIFCFNADGTTNISSTSVAYYTVSNDTWYCIPLGVFTASTGKVCFDVGCNNNLTFNPYTGFIQAGGACFTNTVRINGNHSFVARTEDNANGFVSQNNQCLEQYKLVYLKPTACGSKGCMRISVSNPFNTYAATQTATYYFDSDGTFNADTVVGRILRQKNGCIALEALNSCGCRQFMMCYCCPTATNGVSCIDLQVKNPLLNNAGNCTQNFYFTSLGTFCANLVCTNGMNSSGDIFADGCIFTSAIYAGAENDICIYDREENSAICLYNEGVTLGFNAATGESNSVIIGQAASARDCGVSIGAYAQSAVACAITIGRSAKVYSTGGVAVGHYASAGSGVGIGKCVFSTGFGVAIGQDVQSCASGTDVFIGRSVKGTISSSYSQGVAIGSYICLPNANSTSVTIVAQRCNTPNTYVCNCSAVMIGTISHDANCPVIGYEDDRLRLLSIVGVCLGSAFAHGTATFLMKNITSYNCAWRTSFYCLHKAIFGCGYRYSALITSCIQCCAWNMGCNHCSAGAVKNCWMHYVSGGDWTLTCAYNAGCAYALDGHWTFTNCATNWTSGLERVFTIVF